MITPSLQKKLMLMVVILDIFSKSFPQGPYSLRGENMSMEDSVEGNPSLHRPAGFLPSPKQFVRGCTHAGIPPHKQRCHYNPAQPQQTAHRQINASGEDDNICHRQPHDSNRLKG